MSRIGQAPIPVPCGVDVTIAGRHVTVKGPKGTLERDIPGADHRPPGRRRSSLVERPDDERQNRALHGLTRSLVNNMVVGVTDGFTQGARDRRRRLPRHGPGHRQARARARLQPPGHRRRPRRHHLRGARRPTRIVVTGIDKELVGQVAANIRKIRKPEPYKGKGVRYAGEHVRRKAGKTGEVGIDERQRQAEARGPHPPPPPRAQEGRAAPPSVRASPCSARTSTSSPR